MSTPRDRIEEVGKKIKREADVVTDRTGRRLSLVGTLNTITPCSACKLLRRRCAQDCPFAPYFSPHEPQRRFPSPRELMQQTALSTKRI
ncbi:hypothetical protein C4D60_Mb07t05260 [Musa balbisiana]|uniref:LOB domain-containing protein n=1 Tax=Musa balbisiana TaxID=52838 RepID=A0A4S8JFM7_MUSBA|nr:hypothetical protein C4D60_Mb07t05260 [Musa balbisiana]